MRTIIIGDVHGCLAELQQLIGCVAPTKRDRVVFCGDLVDRGPDSPGVVRYARYLGDRTNITLVRGNHEKKHLRIYNRWEKGKTSASPSAGYIRRIYDRLTEDDKHFLRMSIPWKIIPEHNLIVVHAGFEPTMKELPNHNDYFNHMSNKKRRRWDLVMHTRFVTPHGHMVRLGEETPADVYWAHDYDGRFGHVYFGHQVFLDKGPAKFTHATGLDLGCVYGGYLCAAVVDENEVRFVTVKAQKAYYTSAFPKRTRAEI